MSSSLHRPSLQITAHDDPRPFGCTAADAIEMWDTHGMPELTRGRLLRALLAYVNSDLDDAMASNRWRPSEAGNHRLLSRWVRAKHARILDRDLMREQLRVYLVERPELSALYGQIVSQPTPSGIYVGRQLWLDIPLRATIDGQVHQLASGLELIALGEPTIGRRGDTSVRCWITALGATCSFRPDELLLQPGVKSGAGELLSVTLAIEPAAPFLV